MHTPKRPVKMEGTLQRPCANCRLAALSSGFGFLRSSKGDNWQDARKTWAEGGQRPGQSPRALSRTDQRAPSTDMSIRFPFRTLTVPVRQIAPRVSASKLASYSAAVVLLPLKPVGGGLGGGASWRAIARAIRAQGAERRRLLSASRRRAGRDPARRRLPPCEGKHLRAVATRRETRSRGDGVGPRRRCCCGSKDAAARSRAPLSSPTVAAFEAAAFRFASFKSKPKPRPALARIDIAMGGRWPISSSPSPPSAGNNLARWLTALPPNTLDAAGYRRC